MGDEANEQAAANLGDPVGHMSGLGTGDLPIGHYFARFGSIMLSVPDPAVSIGDTRQALVTALEADSRVTKVEADPLEGAYSHYSMFYPPGHHGSRIDLLTGHDHYHALRMSEPIMFQVHVPLKNQPRIYDRADATAEDYWAAWDGTTLLVLWNREASSIHPPNSGGQVIVDILKDASVKSGMSVHVQACSPGCKGVFAHTDIRVTQFGGDGPWEFGPRDGYLAEAMFEVEGGPSVVLKELGMALLHPGEQFAMYKNRARRLLDVEQEARRLVAELLEIDFRRLVLQNRSPIVRGFSYVWSAIRGIVGAGDRYRAKQIIASLWVAMAAIETLRRDWTMARITFNESSVDNEALGLFDVDRKDDDAMVESISLEFARAAVNQQATGMSNKTLALVTLV